MLSEHRKHVGKRPLNVQRDPDRLRSQRRHGQRLPVCESFHLRENPRMRKRGIREKLCRLSVTRSLIKQLDLPLKSQSVSGISSPNGMIPRIRSRKSVAGSVIWSGCVFMIRSVYLVNPTRLAPFRFALPPILHRFDLVLRPNSQ